LARVRSFTMRSRSVAVVVEDLRGCVLLLLRGSTDPWMPGRWNLPGGKIDPGESAYEAAVRETREEASLRVYALSPLMQVGGLRVFRADDWTGRVRLADGEHDLSAWVPKEIAWTWDLIPPQREVLRRLAGS
jgi:8-oxo-dGTP pyrophosphatase MutT (NUDIX family)